MTTPNEHDQALTDDITLHSERLVVTGEVREWARARVTRRIVTEQRTITVPVRREELLVEYVGDAPAEGRETVGASAQVVASHPVEQIVLHTEVPRVEYDVVPYEEVALTVDTTTRNVQVAGEVAREQLDFREQPER
ncbi:MULTISPECIES: DUF2382 domain-containing protein [unclassified Luteococcus]|uniref:DUF2382 domain-containing protein n=1 Tax=unclassified Luteococcus TaxID=2639923 RepID=UPI00313F2673